MIEGEWTPVVRRQSLRFPADRRHGYRNRTAHDVVLHDIIHYASPPKLASRRLFPSLINGKLRQKRQPT
jgi:hypothetical protein